MNLGSRLRLLRTNRNLTIRDLSVLLRIDMSNIGRYENSHNKPGLDVLIKYKRFFSGISIDYLLEGDSLYKCPRCIATKNHLSGLVLELS